MPTYEYQCFACQHRFEEFQKMADDPITVCPECSKEEVKRIIGATSFVLKGTGWYKTDYGKSGSANTDPKSSGSSDKNGASASKSDSSSDSKPEKKASTPAPTAKASD